MVAICETRVQDCDPPIVSLGVDAGPQAMLTFVLSPFVKPVQVNGLLVQDELFTEATVYGDCGPALAVPSPQVSSAVPVPVTEKCWPAQSGFAECHRVVSQIHGHHATRPCRTAAHYHTVRAGKTV